MCGVFSLLAWFVQDSFDEITETGRKWLFQYIEDNLDCEGYGIGNAVALCFLETISGNPHIERYLLPKSLAFNQSNIFGASYRPPDKRRPPGSNECL